MAYGQPLEELELLDRGRKRVSIAVVRCLVPQIRANSSCFIGDEEGLGLASSITKHHSRQTESGDGQDEDP